MAEGGPPFTLPALEDDSDYQTAETMLNIPEDPPSTAQRALLRKAFPKNGKINPNAGWLKIIKWIRTHVGD
eukprot:8874091-Alexandrium_andersonii.AAC.1